MDLSGGAANMKVFARTPLDIEKVQIPRGQVYIILERCKGCEICIEYCPLQVLQVSVETNARGATIIPTSSPEKRIPVYIASSAL